MEWITNQVRKSERTLYFASLRSRNKHFYDWVVNVRYSTGFALEALKRNPEEIDMVVAEVESDTRNGMWCTLRYCRNKEERESLLNGNYCMEVIDLWEEKTETIVTTNTIAQRKSADE